jgi:hypothetical protein
MTDLRISEYPMYLKSKSHPMSRWALLLSLIAVLFLPLPARADDPPPHRAGLVVVHEEGEVITSCVEFSEETINGVDLLERSGLDLVISPFAGMGSAVCAIDGQGCGADEDCFCQCRASPCRYWAYSTRQPDGSWVVSGLGGAARDLEDGDVDAWIWGDGSEAPPDLSIDEICPPAEPPTPTPVETAISGETVASPTSPAASPTPPPPPAPAESSSSNLVGYVVFGVIGLGLVALLVFALARRR